MFFGLFQEKDDLETQFREVNEKADRASSQLSALQQELERTRQNANEALKAMDVERQQLRSANNKYSRQNSSFKQIKSYSIIVHYETNEFCCGKF